MGHVKAEDDRTVVKRGTDIAVSYENKAHDFLIESSSGGFELTSNVNWIGFYQTSFKTTKNKKKSVPILFTPKENTANTSRTARINVHYTDPGSNDRDFSFTITQDCDHAKFAHENIGLDMTIGSERAYRSFPVVSYSGGFYVATDASWISFYRTSFTTTKGKRTETAILFTPTENTKTTDRVAHVYILFSNRDSRNPDVVFTITQKGKVYIEEAPSITIGDRLYKEPTMRNGIVTIDYEDWTNTDSLQLISFDDEEILWHEAGELPTDPNSAYMGVKNPKCDARCQGSHHRIHAYFTGYTTTYSNRKWEVTPVMCVRIKGGGSRFKNFPVITYVIRFMNISTAPGPYSKRAFTYQETNPTGNPSGYHGSGDTWTCCPFCNVLMHSSAELQSHLNTCEKYIESYTPQVFWVCPICGKTVFGENEIMNHQVYGHK